MKHSTHRGHPSLDLGHYGAVLTMESHASPGEKRTAMFVKPANVEPLRRALIRAAVLDVQTPNDVVAVAGAPIMRRPIVVPSMRLEVFAVQPDTAAGLAHFTECTRIALRVPERSMSGLVGGKPKRRTL